MQLTFEAKVPCVMCGYQLTWLGFVSARINKRSIRTAKGAIYAGPPPCVECGFFTNTRYSDLGSPPTRWVIQEQAEVDKYRRRKGWL